MRSNIDMDTIFSLFFLMFISQVMVEALRDVKVRMPHAVRKGEKALLKCLYDTEGDSLYAVKWYKKGREFYRYTPKENPAMKIFGMHGFRIDRQASNESQLTLDHVSLAAAGKYSCEVSADAPSFHTLIGAGELDVVETPSHQPIVTNLRPKYRVGESLRANCTSRNSKPAANLTWLINDQEVKPSYVKYHRPIKDKNDLESSYASIQFVITEDHLERGKLKIRCRAHIHDIYSKSSERSIEIERRKYHTSSSSSGSNQINVVHGYPYDQYSLHDMDNYDKKDTYMTHIQGDVSSLNSGAGSCYNSIIKFGSILGGGGGVGLNPLILVASLLQLTLLVILISPLNEQQQQHQQEQQQHQQEQQQQQQQHQQEQQPLEQHLHQENQHHHHHPQPTKYEQQHQKNFNCNQHHHQHQKQEQQKLEKYFVEEKFKEEKEQQQQQQQRLQNDDYHEKYHHQNQQNQQQQQQQEVQITRRNMMMNSFYSS